MFILTEILTLLLFLTFSALLHILIFIPFWALWKLAVKGLAKLFNKKTPKKITWKDILDFRYNVLVCGVFLYVVDIILNDLSPYTSFRLTAEEIIKAIF